MVSISALLHKVQTGVLVVRFYQYRSAKVKPVIVVDELPNRIQQELAQLAQVNPDNHVCFGFFDLEGELKVALQISDNRLKIGYELLEIR